MPTRRPASQVARAQAFGERIRALRRTRRLTQREVAEQVPISPGHLSRIETGDYGPPSDETITRLADILDADLIELLQVAGRDPGRRVFEQRVLAELEAIRRQLEEFAQLLR